MKIKTLIPELNSTFKRGGYARPPSSDLLGHWFLETVAENNMPILLRQEEWQEILEEVENIHGGLAHMEQLMGRNTYKLSLRLVHLMMKVGSGGGGMRLSS